YGGIRALYFGIGGPQKPHQEEKPQMKVMLMKPPVLLFLIIAASASPAISQRVIKEKTVRTVDCRMATGDDVLARIDLPKEGEVKKLSLNSIQKTKAGFRIDTDWGGSMYHYEVQFDFRCRRNRFYLYRVKHISMLTKHPERGFGDTTVIKITKPHLPI